MAQFRRTLRATRDTCVDVLFPTGPLLSKPTESKRSVRKGEVVTDELRPTAYVTHS